MNDFPTMNGFWGGTTKNDVMKTDIRETEDAYKVEIDLYGNCSRSFYVGEAVTQEDITAKFEEGILNLTIPKKSPEQIDKKEYIQIQG